MSIPSSVIVITYDGNDITDHVIYSEASFESQMAAMPGTFTLLIRDVDKDQEFITGKEVTLSVDGVLLFGGFLLQATRTYAFSADDTGDLSSVRSREWMLQGSDYNVLLDRRVLRQVGDYTTAIDHISGPIFDGEIIRATFDNYFDLDGINTTDLVLDNYEFPTGYTYKTQGVTMREVLEDFSQYGAVYYIDANKKLNFLPVQESTPAWGFSDHLPDGSSRIGFRDGSMTEDATGVVNDALVWGGSQWAGDGDVVFSRREDATSVTDHGRWQLGENRVGEERYKSFGEVDARAKAIVNGNISGTFAEGSQGLVNPEMQFSCTWFAHDVPSSAHLRGGDVVPIDLWVFSEDAGATPLSLNVPLRSVRITFPTLEGATGDAYVQFDGTFGVLMSDPHWLWAYLRSLQRPRGILIPTANDTTVNVEYGALYQGVPTSASSTVYNIPYAYIGRTTEVYIDGLFQQRDVDYTESDPATGEITFASAPGGDIWVLAYLIG